MHHGSVRSTFFPTRNGSPTAACHHAGRADLVISGHWLLAVSNPGLAAYKPPTVAVRHYDRDDQLVGLERAARQVAEAENAELEMQCFPSISAPNRRPDTIDGGPGPAGGRCAPAEDCTERQLLILIATRAVLRWGRRR